MNPDDLEDRLRAVRPPEPPWDLVLRLRAAGPPAPAPLPGWRQRLGRVFGGPWHPWRVAYAGVAALWVLNGVFWLLTPPPPPIPPAIALANQPPSPADTFAADRTFLLSRHNALEASFP